MFAIRKGLQERACSPGLSSGSLNFGSPRNAPSPTVINAVKRVTGDVSPLFDVPDWLHLDWTFVNTEHLLPAECKGFDAGEDNDTDLGDYAAMQGCFTGPSE
ncbi:MAG: hypothetical protein JSV78_03725 [Phycisphaerales bacterium]|nr:MAG: hypothetical protein JSV78_03725 [Phycisphaerales bacterium]